MPSRKSNKLPLTACDRGLLVIVQLAALVLYLTRPEFAERAQRVKALSLAGNGLTDHHLAMLLDGLQGFGHLERVDLSNNLLSHASVQLLNDVLVQNRAKCVRFFVLLLFLFKFFVFFPARYTAVLKTFEAVILCFKNVYKAFQARAKYADAEVNTKVLRTNIYMIRKT